ncbi:MAG: hypothetical protein AAFU73_05465 [Planctomycetota bacterium]
MTPIIPLPTTQLASVLVGWCHARGLCLGQGDVEALHDAIAEQLELEGVHPDHVLRFCGSLPPRRMPRAAGGACDASTQTKSDAVSAGKLGTASHNREVR